METKILPNRIALKLQLLKEQESQAAHGCKAHSDQNSAAALQDQPPEDKLYKQILY